LIEGFQVDFHAGAAGYGGQVNQAVGGPADGLQHDHRIAHGGFGDQFARLGRAGIAISAARLPLASAMRRRSAWVAGAVALMGSARPSASMMQAMVLAVPITMQVPTEGRGGR
jgi:hypothetical protein